VTGPKIHDEEVYSELSRTIQLVGKETPCSGKSDLFDSSLLVPARALEAIRLCMTTCPVFGECALAGRTLSANARADSVMGGVRYNSKGEQLGIGQLRMAVRGEVSVAELEGRTGDHPAGIDPGDAEASAA
jgi:hypothetical protein